ncbi:hypothetical protein B0H13DRAFT_1898723 [Mycena leptocephala]|nr:hypothetical protein B0H13DRAFT_1898723 [Mycena leptocephala]
MIIFLLSFFGDSLGIRGRQTGNDSGAPERRNERNNYSGDAWCSRAQAKPKPKPKPRPPKPAKPNSNSAKRHKPFGQANRRSLIRGGYYQLVYISSLLDDVRRDGDKTIYSPRDFLMNLEPKMEYFGLRGSEVWSTVMVLYEKDVKKKAAQFVEEEEAEDEKWGKDAVAILKSVQNKVEHVHDVLSVSSGHPWQSPTVLPLLPTCALWGVQRTDPGPLFVSLKKQMAELFVPGLSYRGDIDKDWVALALPKPGMVCWSPETNAAIACLGSITRVLPKHCNKIARVIGIRKPKYTEDYDTIILTAVKSWFDFALEAERKKTPAVKMTRVFTDSRRQDQWDINGASKLRRWPGAVNDTESGNIPPT